MKYLLHYILLCSCLKEGQAVLSTGMSSGDGPYGGDNQSNNMETNDRKERNDENLCRSQIAKVQESVAIVTKVRRQQDDTSGTTMGINIDNKDTHKDELNSERSEFRQYRSNLMSLALCFHEKGATSKAFQIYQGELRRLFKDYAFPLVNIAYIYFRQGEPFQALNSLQMYFKEVEGTHVTDKDSIIFGTPCNSKAMFLEDCISALNLLGLTYFNLYDHQKAISAYNRALEIGENKNSAISAIADIHENLGTLEYELGKYELARASFLRAFLVRNVRRLKVMGTSNYKSADFMPFVQWALLVPPMPRSIEDALGLSHAFNYSLEILKTLIYQGGLGLEIHSCEDTGTQNEIDDKNLYHHQEETCLSIRRNHNDKTELSSLQRLVLRYLKPQDIQLMKNIIPSIPVRRRNHRSCFYCRLSWLILCFEI
jgi:Flp pilus assembly protein TadD, contains TPR repeats